MSSRLTSGEGSSRREFMVSAGLFTASAIASGGIVGALSPKKVEAAALPLPWPYTKLDPQPIAEAAFNNYFTNGGCMSGTGKAIVDALAAQVGSPWNTFNTDFFRLGGGGIVSWGTICGSANAGAAIIQMVAGSSKAGTLVNEFFGWYCDFPFPTTRVDGIHRSGYDFPNQGTSIAKSPLCHESAGLWAHTYQKKISSSERACRCAKVAADCAYKLVELLNSQVDCTLKPGQYPPEYQNEANSFRCFPCHVGATSKYNNSQGVMDCLGCHPDKAGHKV